MNKKMNNLIRINVVIINRTYSLKVERNEEELIRKAVKQINEKITKYREVYSKNDEQDMLAMAILDFARKLNEEKEKKDDSLLLDQIKLLNIDLDEVIQEKNVL